MNLAGNLLAQSRRAAGLSQRALARAARLAQPRIAEIETGRHDATTEQLDRALTPLDRRLVVLPTRRATAADTAEEIRRDLQRGQERTAFRRVLQLNDDLAHTRGALRVALAVAPPAPTGDRRYDAFIAALAEHHLAAGGLPIPEWTSESQRFAKPAWFVVDLPELRHESWSTTPASFARHGVFVDASELESM